MTNRTTTYHFVTRSFVGNDSTKVSLKDEMISTVTGSVRPSIKTKIQYFFKGSFLEETHRTNKNGQCLGTPNTRQYRDPVTGKFSVNPKLVA